MNISYFRQVRGRWWHWGRRKISCFEKLPYGYEERLWTNARRSIRSFAGKEETLTDVDIQGIKVHRPRELMVNPNSFVLLFQENYKQDNKNSRGRVFDYRLGGQNSRFNRLKEEKELQYQEFRSRVELEMRILKKVIKKMIVMIVKMINTTEIYHILRLMLMEASILYRRLSCQVSPTWTLCRGHLSRYSWKKHLKERGVGLLLMTFTKI